MAADQYESRLFEWAHKYNGFARLARSPENLAGVLGPLLREFECTGRIPDWAGVDLLRGWAFHLARSYRFLGHPYPLLDEYPEFATIVEAIENHPDAKVRDRPPSRSGE